MRARFGLDVADVNLETFNDTSLSNELWCVVLRILGQFLKNVYAKDTPPQWFKSWQDKHFIYAVVVAASSDAAKCLFNVCDHGRGVATKSKDKWAHEYVITSVLSKQYKVTVRGCQRPESQVHAQCCESHSK